jgi:hypothetical protein
LLLRLDSNLAIWFCQPAVIQLLVTAVFGCTTCIDIEHAHLVKGPCAHSGTSAFGNSQVSVHGRLRHVTLLSVPCSIQLLVSAVICLCERCLLHLGAADALHSSCAPHMCRHAASVCDGSPSPRLLRLQPSLDQECSPQQLCWRLCCSARQLQQAE